jgi:phage terminase small subunit
MKGRKPELKNVVPLTGDDDGLAYERHRRAAVERAARLKPKGMDRGAQAIWDAEAPAMCHPTVNRLKPENVQEFRMYCEAVARYRAAARAWARKGKTYCPGEGRNGAQLRHLPEYGAMNAFFAQAVTLGGRFGKTPQDERGLSSEGQRELPFGDDFE